MSLRIAAVAVFVTLAPAPARANQLESELAAGSNTCWERTYSAAHLKAHPRQQVAKIRLSAEVQDDGNIAASLGIDLRQRKFKLKFDYAAFGYCKATGSALVCASEWDAGSFTLSKAANGALRVRNSRMIVNPSNYDSEDIASNAVNLGKSDDASWLLTRSRDEGCDIY